MADADDFIGELFLEEKTPDEAQIREAIRRTTIARTFTPVMMGKTDKVLANFAHIFLSLSHMFSRHGIEEQRSSAPPGRSCGLFAQPVSSDQLGH